MNRLAAMHDWPLLIVRALTAVRTAASRSALGITMNGSLPPSSSTLFLMTLPAALATWLPASVLPVSVTAATRRILDHALHLVGLDQQRLEHALGKAGAPEDVLDGERALRHVGGVLEQADVAGHQRRRGEAEHLPEREVPRHHRQHRADRLVGHPALRGAGLDRLVGQEPLGVLGVVAAAEGALGRLLDGGLERLAHLGDHEPAEGLLLRLQDLGRLEHQPPALGEAWCGGGGGRPTRRRQAGPRAPPR